MSRSAESSLELIAESLERIANALVALGEKEKEKE